MFKHCQILFQYIKVEHIMFNINTTMFLHLETLINFYFKQAGPHYIFIHCEEKVIRI